MEDKLRGNIIVFSNDYNTKKKSKMQYVFYSKLKNKLSKKKLSKYKILIIYKMPKKKYNRK